MVATDHMKPWYEGGGLSNVEEHYQSNEDDAVLSSNNKEIEALPVFSVAQGCGVFQGSRM